MTTETSWLLSTIKDNWPDGTFPTDLERVNRNDSTQLDENIRKREGDLQRSNFVGAGAADRSTEPQGTAYDKTADHVVDVRVEGLHESEYGHVADHDAFRALVENIKTAIDQERSYPDNNLRIGSTTYHTLIIEIETDRSSNYEDFYDYRFSVRFQGFEELP